MVEVPPVVAAKDPQVPLTVQRGVDSEECLQALRHVVELGAGEYAVDPTIEAPDEIPGAHLLRQKYANPVNYARPQFRFNHHHENTLRRIDDRATNSARKRVRGQPWLPEV
jgi:hypothetical protein